VVEGGGNEIAAEGIACPQPHPQIVDVTAFYHLDLVPLRKLIRIEANRDPCVAQSSRLPWPLAPLDGRGPVPEDLKVLPLLCWQPWPCRAGGELERTCRDFTSA
jgi:hypothetical protein